MISGLNGVSSGVGAFTSFHNSILDNFIPFHHLSKYTFSLCADLSIKEKIKIMYILIKLNIKAVFLKVWLWLYSKYFKYVRSIVRKS